MVYTFFVKKYALPALSEIVTTRDEYASRGVVKNKTKSNQESAKELHKAIIEKFKK